ncbi:MAG: hypothetical protein ACETWK_06215 [Candidatus Aminicenantaceae bacterium]
MTSLKSGVLSAALLLSSSRMTQEEDVKTVISWFQIQELILDVLRDLYAEQCAGPELVKKIKKEK